MLDLRSMSDEDFSVLVTQSVSRTTMRVTVSESGAILFSSKVAEKLSKIPVRIQFNRGYTAIQISKIASETEEGGIILPKNGRKTGLNAAEILKENHIPLPAVFHGYFCSDDKWRGERQQNPTSRHSQTIRSTKTR